MVNSGLWSRSIPEILGDLEHTLESADQEPLEIEFVRDPEEQRHVERVVVGGEGPGEGAPVLGLQDRGFDFEVSPAFEIPPDFRNDSRTEDEGTAHVRIDGQVGVALPVAGLLVGERVVHDLLVAFNLFLDDGKRPQGLGQQGQFSHL
jgi:hypothetical protein